MRAPHKNNDVDSCIRDRPSLPEAVRSVARNSDLGALCFLFAVALALAPGARAGSPSGEDAGREVEQTPAPSRDGDKERSADNRGPDPKALDRIEVTARKRRESLNRIPAAVTVFGRAEIQVAGIDDVDELSRLTPGFTYNSFFGSALGIPVIRGTSQVLGEPNVGFFIDGVYQGSRATMDTLLFDIERVEVLKGPQTALYGRNTFGGAVNFVTRPPADEPEGELELTRGSGGLRRARLSASAPLAGDWLFARAGFLHRDLRGHFTNELTGDPLDKEDTQMVALALEGFPAQRLDFRLRAAIENTDNRDDPQQFVDNNFAPFDPTQQGFPQVPQMFKGPLPGIEGGAAVTPGEFDRDYMTLSGRVRWRGGGYELTAITGFNHLETDETEDFDFSPREIRRRDQSRDRHAFSQELRLQSPRHDAWQWSAGAYYYNLDRRLRTDNRFIGDAAAFGGLVAEASRDTENVALYGSLDYMPRSDVTLSLAARYSYEKKSVQSVDTDPLSGDIVGRFADQQDWHNLTPSLSLQYDIDTDQRVYARVARAVNAGGFNVMTVGGAIAPDERRVDQESSLNYELGYKAEWANGRVSTSLAGFWVDWKDHIVQALGESGVVLNDNAAATTSRGVELSLKARPVVGLLVRAGATYTDAHYDRYNFEALSGLGLEPDLSGVRLQYVSDWTAHLFARYARHLGGGIQGFASADFSYQGDQAAIQTADPLIPATTLLAVRAGLEWRGLQLELWVENLLDEDAPLSAGFIPDWKGRFEFLRGATGAGPVTGFTAFNPLVEARPPRTWGVTARWRF